VFLARVRKGLRDLSRFEPSLEPFAFSLLAALCGRICSVYGPAHLFDTFSLAFGYLLTALFLGCLGAFVWVAHPIFAFLLLHISSFPSLIFNKK